MTLARQEGEIAAVVVDEVRRGTPVPG